MSWSASTVVPVGTPSAEVRSIIGEATVHGQDTVEAHAAFGAAADSAAALIVSGIVGSLDDSGFRVQLNGHANPGFEAPPGWSNDCVGVQIGRIPLD